MHNDLITENVLVGGCRIAGGAHGAGEPVVLLHGTPSSSLIWRKVAPRLVEAGYRVHVFDLLGFGLSERPQAPGVDTSISAQVAVLEKMLAHWKLERFHLVAHDIGGGIAQRFGVFHSDRLKSLTLIDVVSYDSYPSPRTRQQMEQGLEALIKAPDAAHRAHFRQWLLGAVHDKKHFAEGPLETYLDYISGPIGQGSLFQHQVRHYDPVHTLEIADRLSVLGRLPVQLIWGAEDAWQTPDWALRLHEAIPNSQLTILNDCGHFAPEDQPEAIAELILRLVERRSTATS
ncbi:alpha/beta hydrolase [Aurantimonas sp. 22II-16-19i]|uniref:alpha/beta fold hydrolase n=1 Tax=Aurantimonas sp. 22II-16-19i TaxID=1317114 RepID=UPI0009F7D650|nr:alpha/beta hydrolase [Aurantimonas sp. 22II-16-19i]ORE90738.1 alpha/beta hydrolase fold protein [Aurantimonas sp. 22II-16-19i]